MGAYSPTPSLTPALEAAALDGIIRPALAEMTRRGTPFRGVLYAGLMLTAEGAKLIEFNVRFGDPECQVLMLRLKSDLLAALLAACDGELADFDLRWSDEAAITVVLAARGYPADPVKHSPIGALPATEAPLFHAGTALRDGRLVSSGGRVLDVCGLGASLAAARRAAYMTIDAIAWPDGFCRRDIGWRALERDRM
jgi:phosphoribosylamine--glycine ligase